MKGVTGLPSPYELSVWMMAPAYNLLMEWLHQKTTDETQILWGGPIGYLAQYAGSTCQRTLWMCSCRCPHNPVQQDCRTSRHICAQFFLNPNCSVTAAAVWLCDVKIDTWHHINREDQNTYSSRAKASQTSFLRALHLSGKTKTVASFFLSQQPHCASYVYSVLACNDTRANHTPWPYHYLFIYCKYLWAFLSLVTSW